jgi:hypothetical protein
LPVDSTGRFRRRHAARRGSAAPKAFTPWHVSCVPSGKGDDMNNIIYLIGLVVVVVAILGFFGLR